VLSEQEEKGTVLLCKCVMWTVDLYFQQPWRHYISMLALARALLFTELMPGHQ